MGDTRSGGGGGGAGYKGIPDPLDKGVGRGGSDWSSDPSFLLGKVYVFLSKMT